MGFQRTLHIHKQSTSNMNARSFHFIQSSGQILGEETAGETTLIIQIIAIRCPNCSSIKRVNNTPVGRINIIQFVSLQIPYNKLRISYSRVEELGGRSTTRDNRFTDQKMTNSSTKDSWVSLADKTRSFVRNLKKFQEQIVKFHTLIERQRSTRIANVTRRQSRP